MEQLHTKYHRNNHHTDHVSSDYDSAHDSIASLDNPFKGGFYLNGSLVVSGDMTIEGDFALNDLAGGYPSATRFQDGVIRFSIDPEDIAHTLNDVAITPKTLAYIETIIGSRHELSGSNFPTVVHSDVDMSLIAPVEDDFLVYSSSLSKWVPSASSAIVAYAQASSDQASGGSTYENDIVWISPKQLHIELDRQFNVLTTTPQSDSTAKTIIITARNFNKGRYDMHGLYVKNQLP